MGWSADTCALVDMGAVERCTSGDLHKLHSFHPQPMIGASPVPTYSTLHRSTSPANHAEQIKV